MANKWKWYGAKTVYRLEPEGKPEATDADFWGEGSLVEERVVLIRARSYQEATRKAEREAVNYAASSDDRNPYRQTLALRYLGGCDVYELTPDEDLASGTEVFSMTELAARSVTDEAILRRHVGAAESKIASRRRKNFCLLLFSGPVAGVVPTKSELAYAKRIGVARSTRKE